MKNILLPTDFSQNASNAIEYAIQLFKDEDCTFHLLNTFTPVAYNVATLADSYSTMMIEEITRQNSESGLLEIEKELKKKFKNPKHTFQVLSSFNLLIPEIKAVIKERNIDLIVMGTKGATGAKEVFLGTNTMFTIKKVKCAVIAVPENFTYEDPKEILFPTDFKFSMKNKYLKLLKSICTRHISRLNILNVYLGEPLDSSQKKTKEQFEDFFKNNAHLFHTAEYVDLTEAVTQFQIKYKANFLVMVNNKHSFFENLFFKQVIKKMVYHTNVPFMVIPSIELMAP
ncbi:MAG: universal stress protein [Aequorivita sp.]